MLKWLYLNISLKSFITLPWACPVNWSVTKSPILYLHSFSHFLPWKVSKSKFDFSSFRFVRKPYLLCTFEFKFEKICIQQYWFTVCRFDFFRNDFITWLSEMVFKLSLLYNIEHKSYLALSFGRTHVIGIGGIPIIATPFITLEKYFLWYPCFVPYTNRWWWI